MQTKKECRILGIDPGFGRMGWGVIEGEKRTWRHIAHGCLETSPKKPFVDRLFEISECMDGILDEYAPDAAGVEKLFFAKNAKTAMQVGEARGVILLTLRERHIPITEITPMQVKQAVVGYGKADKRQVQHMIALQLNLKSKKMQDDAADALAVALTCALIHT